MAYIDFAKTPIQKEVAGYLDKGITSSRKIAKEIGKDDGWVRRAAKAVRERAEKKGYDPAHGINRPIDRDSRLQLSGMSDMRENELGKPIWYKFNADADEIHRQILRAAKAITEDQEPFPVIPTPQHNPNTDIIPWYNIGDAHLGLLAHESQVGHNFNLDIGERELHHAMCELIDRTEPCERCVVQDMGDGTHYENESATTAHSGHPLDAAAPIADVIEVYARTLKRIIDKALSRHLNVDVIINQGNHSRVNDLWMAVHLRHMYSNNERVNILDNRSVFIPYRMGNTFVLCHHTDKCKPQALAGVMASDFAQDWGETLYHYIDGGHVHHRQTAKELNGAIYESWNQLAPSDKYAHDGGWRSRQLLTCVLRSKTYGEKGRIAITAEEVKDRIDQLTPGTTSNNRREVYTV